MSTEKVFLQHSYQSKEGGNPENPPKRGSNIVPFSRGIEAVNYLLSLSDEEFKSIASKSDRERLLKRLINVNNNSLEDFIKLCMDKFKTNKAIIYNQGKNIGVQPIRMDENGKIVDVMAGVAYFRASN